MYSATLDKIAKGTGDFNVVATVTIKNSDTGEIHTEDVPGNDLTPDHVASFVAGRIQELQVRDLAFQTLALGAIAVPAKTVEQQAQLDKLTALIPVQPAPMPTS
jgi:hypothetical protein